MKMKYKRICVHCGKIFYSKSHANKYCSKVCRAEVSNQRLEKNGQLCCLCKRASGGCAWSDKFMPVEGWDAEPTIINEGDGRIVHSFKIKNCPLYIYG